MSSTLPTDPEGSTGQLCNWVESVSLDEVPAEIIVRAKYLILDGLACGLVGAHLPWSEKAAKAIFDMEPPGDSSIFGWEKVNIFLFLLEIRI
jgi:aconitate decarboxylase